MDEERVREIVVLTAQAFTTFGGGCVRDTSNPIAMAMQNQPAQFALGVDVASVVRFVIDHYEMYKRV